MSCGFCVNIWFYAGLRAFLMTFGLFSALFSPLISPVDFLFWVKIWVKKNRASDLFYHHQVKGVTPGSEGEINQQGEGGTKQKPFVGNNESWLEIPQFKIGKNQAVIYFCFGLLGLSGTDRRILPCSTKGVT